MEEFLLYKAGQFARTDKSLLVTNPYTQQNFAQTYLAGVQELKDSIDAANRVRKELSALSSFERYTILMQIAEEMHQQRRTLAELLCNESAKPMRYAAVEIDRAIQVFKIAAEETKRLPKEYLSLDWTKGSAKKEAFVKHIPLGVVAGISPFNFPMNLAVHKIAPALAAGCPIILKPASATPLSTLALARIVDQTALPKGALSVLPMNRQTGNRLVTDERIHLLSFTGSDEVGWSLKQQAGRKRTVLELGGNAAVYVGETADLDLALQKSLYGGFVYSGQVCIHVQRIYVHQQVFGEFLNRFIPMVENLKSGDPLNLDTDVSVMIDKENAQRVKTWVDGAVAGGAVLLSGGGLDGNFVQPTLLTNVKPGMKVRDEEVFGPVVLIEPVESLNEALSKINDSRYGLQAGIFTQRIDEVDQAFEELEVGGVIVNDVPTFRADHMPYGGMKDSGQGREGVRYAMLDMMEPKVLVK